jgi:hypothetical protein
MSATIITARRSTRRTSVAFRAATQTESEPTHCCVLRCPWGEIQIIERGSLEKMLHEAAIWNREKGYRCTVKPLAAMKLAAAA